MRNWSMRERAGLAAIVLAVVMGALGLSINRYQQTLAQDEPPALTQLTPPKTGVDIAARGGSTGVTITEPGSDGFPASKASLVVHVLGAVRRPGVYTLKSGNRVYNAIQAAGWFKPNAAQETLNLAERLRDGDQVYVAARTAPPSVPTSVRHDEVTAAPAARPRRSAARTEPERGRVLGAVPPPPSASRSIAPASGAAPKSGSPSGAVPRAVGKAEKLHNPDEGTVNINTADAEELQRLPGIGPAMAGRILDYRQEIGKFNSPEQLMDVRGIGEKKYAVMEPFLRVK